MTPAERAHGGGSWRVSMAPLYERRTGPRKVALEPDARAGHALGSRAARAPAIGPTRDRFVRSDAGSGAAARDATTTSPSRRSRGSRAGSSRAQLTSERLTRIYLERIERFEPEAHAASSRSPATWRSRRRAQADAEIAAGQYRGPLHGIPYGAKDLLDTAGIATTYGAEPFRNRVPDDGRGRRRAAAPTRARCSSRS